MRHATLLPAAAVCLSLCCFTSVQADTDFEAQEEKMEARIERSLKTYTDLQESILAEKTPLLDSISDLENRMFALQDELETIRSQTQRDAEQFDSLRDQQASLKSQNDYAINLLDEYLNSFESRLNIAEDQRFEQQLDTLRDQTQLLESGSVEAIDPYAEILESGLDRLEQIIGGYTFDGKAVDSIGVVTDGSITVFGPSSYFSSTANSTAGLLSFKVGTTEPSVSEISPGLQGSIRAFHKDGAGVLPLDSSQGKAITLSKAKGSLKDHVDKGGLVGYLIITMGFVALLLALVKLVDFRVLSVSRSSHYTEIAQAATSGKLADAQALALKAKGWMGAMLSEGARYANDDRDLLEDHMLGVILEKKPRLERFLPWLAVTAAAAPLMGLLGTVVGMIKTFTLISIFGSGDPKALSSGISEALITTELGLIIAIPTLIVHGALLRIAKMRIGSMKMAAAEFSKRVAVVENDSANHK